MNALLVVAKRPQPGQTKTRLTPPLSPLEASQLYEHFLRDTLDLMRHVPNTKCIIAYLPEDEEGYFRSIAPDFDLLPQKGIDLGERLDNALIQCLTNGFEKAVIMDSDSPTLPADCLTRAFTALESADVTLGPCDDGGYYLIGLRRPAPRLLREVRMSTPDVLSDTLRLAAEENLRVQLLETWYDVDTAGELERLRAELANLQNGRAAHTRSFFATNTCTSTQGQCHTN